MLRCVYADLDGTLGGSLVRAADGTFTLLGVRLELEDAARVRMAEERGPAALYEAVITTLAERSR